nr:unnamed protein product [Callosobruchus chinensis]
MMYNATPHGTTGKSPSELLFNRNIRDKIPSISDLIQEPGDEEARENDLINKQKGKEREDRARRAETIEIREGDKVLVKNVVVPHKLTTGFDKKKYTVLKRENNEITIRRADGHILKRHISHVKKVPTTDTDTQTQIIIPEESRYLPSQLQPLQQPMHPAQALQQPTESPLPEETSDVALRDEAATSARRMEPMKLKPRMTPLVKYGGNRYR